MPETHVAWFIVGGVSMPAILTQTPEGFIAASADWRITRTATDACTALSRLGSAVEDRIRRAMAQSRAEALQ